MFLLEYAQEIGCFAESGPGSGSGPSSRVVHGEVPRGSSAQGKPTDHQPVFIDWITPFDFFESLPEVGFSGETAAVAIASIEVEHERVRRSEFPEVLHPVGDECQFAQGFAPSVEPEIQAP